MTPIRSILMHADATTAWADRLAHAAAIARTFDAELTTLYAPPSAWSEFPLAMMGSPDAAAILRTLDEQRLRQARAAYDQAAAAIEGRLHWQAASAWAPERAMTHMAFAADLLILGQQPPTSQQGGVDRHFVESVVIRSGRPAMVVPYIGAPATSEVVLVAWKDTRESARAVTEAIPFLQRARRVYLATWTEDEDSMQSGVDVAGYLRRHGIEVTAKACGAAPPLLGEAMLSLVADLSADLLVMGCYGHSRAHELVLGGATRTILQAMTVPVLMAH